MHVARALISVAALACFAGPQRAVAAAPRVDFAFEVNGHPARMLTGVLPAVRLNPVLEEALERSTFSVPHAMRKNAFAGTEHQQLVALPPAPNSSVLVMFALGGLGVWQLGSSARKWQWHAAPEWFSTHGPQQIGHATVLDLSFALLPVYPNSEVRLSIAPSRCVALFEEGPVYPLDVFLNASTPRGPPHLAS